MSGKRTYTVPVLLLIITVLATLLIILLSRLLIDGQANKLEKGRQLASGYNYCLAYAGVLKNETGDLATSLTAADRLAVKEQLGQIPLASAECAATLSESGSLSGQSKTEAMTALAADMEAIWSKLEPIGNHDGALTQEERDTLKIIGDAGSKLEATLAQYDVPTGDDRLRQMVAGLDWSEPAQQAVKQLQDLAAALKAR